MSRRLIVLGVAAICALAFSAVSAVGASAAGTAYVGGVEVAAGTSTGLELDATTSQVLRTEQFGANLELTGTEIDCVNCMAENQNVGGVMDVTGSGGRLLYSHVTTNIASCSASDPTKGAGTVTTEPLKVTSNGTHTAKISPLSGTVLAVIHLVGASCPVAGEYPVEGFVGGVTSGSTLSVEQAATELTVFGEFAELTGSSHMTAGTTGGSYQAATLE